MELNWTQLCTADDRGRVLQQPVGWLAGPTATRVDPVLLELSMATQSGSMAVPRAMSMLSADTSSIPQQIAMHLPYAQRSRGLVGRSGHERFEGGRMPSPLLVGVDGGPHC